MSTSLLYRAFGVRGAIVYVGEGKGGAALSRFWRRLRASGAEIEAVATHLSLAYVAAVGQHLPEAVLVFDRFHLVKLLYEHLAELRRELYREATNKLHKRVLKGTRWLLLKHPDNLDVERKEPRRLGQALALNQSLAVAYYLKEDLRQLWEQEDWVDAESFLEDWCDRAEESGIRRLQTFAKTLQAHRTGILAWYDYPISTGPLEGINNKITVLKRQAYGYRNQRLLPPQTLRPAPVTTGTRGVTNVTPLRTQERVDPFLFPFRLAHRWMALTLEQFTEQLTDSGLMSADDLTEYIGNLPEQPTDAEALAKKL